MSDLADRIKNRVSKESFIDKLDGSATIRARDVISIVDEEVVKEETCRWTKIDDEHWTPSCESNAEYGVTGVAWFRVCPYCGRKIEVIE